MSQVNLEANVREKTGKGVARKLRAQGRIPGVLYGHRLETPIALDLDLKAITEVLHTGGRTAVIRLTLQGNGGGSHSAMIADYQRNILTSALTHVDLKQVTLDELVHAKVPIILTGTARGVKTGGGVMEQILREIEVEALPLDVPEILEIDVSDMDSGSHITVADLNLPANVTVATPPEETVAVVHGPRTATATEEAEGTPAEVAAAAQE